MGRLDGRVAIVTGGAKGIGRHYSFALAGERARVMIADIVDGSAIAAEIAVKHGANSVAAEICDVSEEAAVKRLVDATLARFGQIDVLVNNAALYAPLHETKFTEIDVDLWDKVMAINLRGPFLMAKHVAPEMAKRQYGKIINIGSGTAVRGIPWLMHYVTSKGGIMGFTRALAGELGPHGITVNAIAPSLTRTPGAMARKPRAGIASIDEEFELVAQGQAIRRVEVPDDLTGTVSYLTSDDAAFVTGQMINVNGGRIFS